MKKYNVEVAHEYARTYIMETGPIVSIAEQIIIYHGQNDLELKLSQKCDYVISDTSSFIGYVYGCMLDKGNLKDCYSRELLHRLCRGGVANYQYIFFLEHDGSGIIQDGIRVQNDADQLDIEKRVRGFMDAEGIKYSVISGIRNIDEKVNDILSVMKIKL